MLIADVDMTVGESNVARLRGAGGTVALIPQTCDILPNGSTGLYWANEILIGSTLSRSPVCGKQLTSRHVYVEV